MMKVRRLLIAVATLILCCLFNSCEKEPGSIYGVVTDYSTGEPVANANVQLRPGGSTTLTGTDGMYEFLDIPVGSYFITVSKAEYTDLVDDDVIEVKNGKKVRRDVQIKKKPASLHIYDNDSNEITELDFGADWGVTQKPFNIFNGGTQAITFTITKTVGWISSISQTTGTINVGATCPILITIDRALLSAGDNTTTLVVYATDGGSKELTVKANKSGALPTVSIAEPVAIDSVTYRFKCEVVSDGGQTVTERGICWNTFGDPTVDDQKIQNPSGGTGQYTVLMEHLTIGTKYYVRAYAKSAFGVGYSQVIKFTANNGSVNEMSGIFSVEPTTFVYFAPGNLQYQASTHTWRFTNHQYDVVGSSNANISSTYSGWIDLFGWGTGNNPTNSSTSSSSYSTFTDWGNNVISNASNTSDSWRTLTASEWKYVFDTRYTTSGIRYARARVNNVNGVLLLPDDWDASTFSLKNTNSGSADFSSNVINATQWNTLEEAGAVFLPAAGIRDGTSVLSVGSLGSYWSASYGGSNSAYDVWFNSYNLYPQYSRSRYSGQSVRLVRSAQ